MNVAIYMDLEDGMELLNNAIKAARINKDATIIHITTPDGPASELADKVLRTAIGNYVPEKRAAGYASVEGETLFIGSDVICTEDVSDVFNDDFDVAVTTDIKPGEPRIKYNGDVTFSRNPQFWKDLGDMQRGMPWPHGPWFEPEYCHTVLADSGKYKTKVLDGYDYNYVPDVPGDVSGKLVHFRGARKKWMGLRVPEYIKGLNIPSEKLLGNVTENLKRDLPWLTEQPVTYKEAIIVGGGPSLAENLEDLKSRASDHMIFALNGSYDYLQEKGIIADYHVILDAREENSIFVERPNSYTKYYIGAQCDPSVFNSLKHYDVTMWFSCEEGMEVTVGKQEKRVILVTGGPTVGCKTMFLAYLLGHRTFRFYGFDSCYRDGQNHAYPQPLNAKDEAVDVYAGDRKFVAAKWMIHQADWFLQQMNTLSGLGCDVYVHGDGLISHMIRVSQEA